VKDLAAYLDGAHSSVQVDLRNNAWHRRRGIPSEPGWYYISTDAPVEILQRQSLWSTTYLRAKDQKQVPVRNYNLQLRASRYSSDLATYFNTAGVYSGLASSLRARAREHTFADPGTGGLALARYPELFDYEWIFNFVTLKRFMKDCQCNEVILRLGEQLWRSKHGWPILCAE
jgi:hypothetical protein